MKQVVLNIEEGRYAQLLNYLKTLSYVQIVHPQPSVSKRKYNFSDLLGKLEWNGDALHEQRRLRDEW